MTLWKQCSYAVVLASLLAMGSADANQAGGYEWSQGFTAYFTEKDFGKAAQWFEQAIAKGHEGALISMGDLYRRGGKGLEKDPELARQWYEKGLAAFERRAANGDLRATEQVAELYFKGDKVSKNYLKARHHYEKLAASGNRLAMVRLGAVHEFGGHGIDKDAATAIDWYQQAHARGADVSAPLARLGALATEVDAEEGYRKALAEASTMANPSRYRGQALSLYEKRLREQGESSDVVSRSVAAKLQDLVAVDFQAVAHGIVAVRDIPVEVLLAPFPEPQKQALRELVPYLSGQQQTPADLPQPGQSWAAFQARRPAVARAPNSPNIQVVTTSTVVSRHSRAKALADARHWDLAVDEALNGAPEEQAYVLLALNGASITDLKLGSGRQRVLDNMHIFDAAIAVASSSEQTRLRNMREAYRVHKDRSYAPSTAGGTRYYYGSDMSRGTCESAGGTYNGFGQCWSH